LIVGGTVGTRTAWVETALSGGALGGFGVTVVAGAAAPELSGGGCWLAAASRVTSALRAISVTRTRITLQLLNQLIAGPGSGCPLVDGCGGRHGRHG
jgi:hypothetical protein